VAPFVNRRSELDALRAHRTTGRAELLVVYGRRRVGKTELLRTAYGGDRHLYFVADLGADVDQRRRLAAQIYARFPSRALAEPNAPSWELIFEHLFDAATERPLVVVLDEFPYLCISHKALPSILQRLWDERGRHSKICLVLCGSYVSFMEREVLAHKSPLFGRRTGQLLLEPLSFSSLREFFPRYGAIDRVRVHAVLGGVPAYLAQFSDAASLESNIETAVLGATAPLREEVRFILTEELRDPKQYLSVLEAISFGHTRLNEIVQHTALDRGPASKYLAVLQELRLVEREVPVTEPAPHQSRKGIYRISDPFFRFWFRFVNAHRSELADRGAHHVLTTHIVPHLELFVGQAFEQTCREIVRDLVQAGRLRIAYDRLGRHWDREMEVDLVAMREGSPVLAGECKWSRKPVGENILAQLRQKAARLSGSGPTPLLALFSRSGFTPAVRRQERESELLLVDVRRLD